MRCQVWFHKSCWNRGECSCGYFRDVNSWKVHWPPKKSVILAFSFVVVVVVVAAAAALFCQVFEPGIWWRMTFQRWCLRPWRWSCWWQNASGGGGGVIQTSHRVVNVRGERCWTIKLVFQVAVEVFFFWVFLVVVFVFLFPSPTAVWNHFWTCHWVGNLYESPRMTKTTTLTGWSPGGL